MTDDLIQRITAKLAFLPDIEGIVLGGSRARGTHTRDSDIDIGIYYRSDSFDLNAINHLSMELDDAHRSNLVNPPGSWGNWINGGGWLIVEGYPVDLMLRDIERVKQIIKDTNHGIVTANYQTEGILMALSAPCIVENWQSAKYITQTMIAFTT